MAQAQQNTERVSDLKNKAGSLIEQARLFKKKRLEKQQEAQKYQANFVKNQRELEKKRQSRHYHVQTREYTKSKISYLDSKLDRTAGEASRLGEDAGKRLRSVYMGERLSMLQMILEAKDLASLLDRLYYKQKMVSQDKELLKELRRKIEELQNLKVELAQQKQRLDSTIQTIQVQEGQIARLAEMDKAMRDKYLKDARYYGRAEAQLLAESSRITSEIRALTAKRLTLGKNVATGSMMWPVRGKITSNFGYRVHPIHRVRTLHTGLDISGPNGAPIKAADGGQVIFAGWKGGYGKCIMVNHGFKGGRSIVTLYGHLSGIAAGNGAYVTKGQVIGYEGSTGYSTGPHLHFEVRVNGSPVNPAAYL